MSGRYSQTAKTPSNMNAGTARYLKFIIKYIIMSEEPHFGKLLAEISGIDLDELNAEIDQARQMQIDERPHFKLDNELEYIKNQYEFFSNKPTHYLSDNPKEHNDFNLKIAAYLTLNRLKRDSDLERIIGNLEDYFEYEDEIKEFMLKNRLIESYEYGDGFWDFVYEINPYEELKEYAESENIDVCASKRELVNRFEELQLYEDFQEIYFKLSENGLRYFNSNRWIGNYLIFLDCFDFYEFEDFLNENSDDFMNIAYDFLKRHYDMAIKRGDFKALIDVQSAKSLYHIINGNVRGSLDEELKLFMARLNPICSDADELLFHEPIDCVNIFNISNLLATCQIEDIEHLFSRNWNSLKFKNPWISKEKSFDYFTKALTGNDLEELNISTQDYYFKE